MVERYKRDICEIGKRLWLKNYVDGNGGNISVKISENQILCTPTLISKGFMQPEDICIVNIHGEQLAGDRPATSEIATHLTLYKNNPSITACVHAHPPHATSFAICGYAPEELVTPEAKIFLDKIGFIPFEMPGSVDLSKLIAPLAQEYSTIILGNHGAITSGNSLEKAYWRMENLEAYCQVYLIAKQHNRPIHQFNKEQQNALSKAASNYN